MRHRAGMAAGFLAGAVVLAGAGAVSADETAPESKNEVVVFGGASILDASRSRDMVFGMPDWAGRRWPVLPDVQVRAEASLGDSGLFGTRYSRYVKGRLAVEADFAVAPNHDLEAEGSVCLDGRCFGSGAGGRMRGPWGGGGAEGDMDLGGRFTRNVTAWHYGAGLAYDITGGDVRPVVIFGAGGVSYSGVRDASTDFVLRFGAGLKIHLGSRLGARVDVVDHLVTNQFLTGDAEHDVHATAGLLLRF